MKFLLWFFRLLILLLLLLPLLIPQIEKVISDKPISHSKFWILVPSQETFDYKNELKIENLTEKFFNNKSKPVVVRFGINCHHPVCLFDDLLEKLNSLDGQIVIASHARLWGVSAKEFSQKVVMTKASLENRVHYYSLLSTSSSSVSTPFSFALSHIQTPPIAFLGEDTPVTLNFVRMNQEDTLKGDVVVRIDGEFIQAIPLEIKIEESQLVVSVPITLKLNKAGKRVLSVEWVSPLAKSPLDFASTLVQVSYSRTTLLHLGISPDLSLRKVRAALKIWPNLDLLSYYILRDLRSDNMVPDKELSLIAFPAEKLFSEELKNIHGVIVQNFNFLDYLNEKDANNLHNYIVNGGRMVLFGGPLSYSIPSNSPTRMSDFMPCKSPPEWVFDKKIHFKIEESLRKEHSYLEQTFRKLDTFSVAENCEPREDAVVLARTHDGKHPLVVVRKLGQGIILSILSGDWHLQETFAGEEDKSNEVLENRIAASEVLFTWMVDFLQRRHDLGFRPPKISEQRIFTSATSFEVDGQFMDHGFNYELTRDEMKLTDGKLKFYPHLEKYLLEFPQSLEASSFFKNSKANASQPHLSKMTLHQTSNEVTVKPFHWLTLDNGSYDDYPGNPLVFQSLPTLKDKINSQEHLWSKVHKKFIPLLEAYPWLLALLFFIFASEQILYLMIKRK